MPNPLVSYADPGVALHASAFAVTTGEQDVLIVTDPAHVCKSQYTVFADFTLGAATSIKLRYYYTPDKVNWYQVPIKNGTTGELANIPSVLDAGSPTKVTEDVAVSAALGFKVTAQSVGAAATINNLYVCSRNN